MSRYIDSDLCEDYFYEHLDDNGMAGAMNAIREIPTADVRENVHGEWQVYYDDDSPQDGIWKCSMCSYIRLADDISPTDFCPRCGTIMDGDKYEQIHLCR